MGYVDTVTEHLYRYAPPLTKKKDFSQFWEATLKEAEAVPLCSEKNAVDYPSPYVRVYRISYNGMDETRINGWFIIPAFSRNSSYPCIIHYHGFTGSKGTPSEFMHWIMMGFAVISIDCREQGGSTGHHSASTNGYSLNLASKGVHNKYEYYYRYVYMDCLRAIDFVCEQEEVDHTRIILEGSSQGGALGMAVASLDDRAMLAMVDVPSNSDLVSRIEGNHGAFSSVTEYLKLRPDDTDLVLDTLSYFDTMNMADQIKCRVFASVALMDEVCPPQMYFASYNRIQSQKEMIIYPFNGHEGGGANHTEAKLRYLKRNYPEWFVL